MQKCRECGKSSNLPVCEKCFKVILKKAKEIKSEYFLATLAYHLLADVSFKNPQICCIIKESDKYWIGHFIEGMGLIDILFPKTTTRKAQNVEEAKQFLGSYGIDGHVFNDVALDDLLQPVGD